MWQNKCIIFINSLFWGLRMLLLLHAITPSFFCMDASFFIYTCKITIFKRKLTDTGAGPRLTWSTTCGLFLLPESTLIRLVMILHTTQKKHHSFKCIILNSILNLDVLTVSLLLFSFLLVCNIPLSNHILFKQSS